MSGVSAARLGFHGHVMSQIKTWKRLFNRGRQSQTLITLPPLIKWWCVSMCKHFTRKLMFYAIQCHVNFCPFSFCVFFPVFFSLYKEWNHNQFCMKIYWVVPLFPSFSLLVLSDSELLCRRRWHGNFCLLSITILYCTHLRWKKVFC